MKQVLFRNLPALAAALLLLPGCISQETYETQEYPALNKPDAELMNALTFPDRRNFVSALEKGAAVNARDGVSGQTALMKAVISGHDDFVEDLLKRGASVNERDRKGCTALYFASAQNHPEITERLLNGNADPNPAGSRKRTPLMEAARLGRLENVRLLLAHHADTEIQDEKGRTALHYAASAPKNSCEILKLLLARGAVAAVLDSDAATPVIAAVRNGNTQGAFLLIDHAQERRAHDAERAKVELKNDVVLGLLLMKQAIYAGNQEVVERLLKLGMPLNLDIGTAYKTAEIFNVHGVNKILARHQLISDGKMPLIWAAEKDNLEMVRLLLKYGADPHAQDKAGNQALNYASQYQVVRELKKAMR